MRQYYEDIEDIESGRLSFDFRGFLFKALNSWKIIVLCIGVALTAAYFINVRKPNFDLENDLAHDWFDGSAFKTAFENSFSLLFPLGERAFIESVKHFEKDIKDAFEFGKGLNDESEALQNLQSRKSIHAELELLRSPSNKDIPSPRKERKASVDEKRDSPSGNSKANLVASFFSPETRARSSSLSADKTKIMREPKDDFLKNERRGVEKSN